MSFKSFLACCVKLPFYSTSSPLARICFILELILCLLEKALLLDRTDYSSYLLVELALVRFGANEFTEMLLDLYDLTDSVEGSTYFFG